MPTILVLPLLEGSILLQHIIIDNVLCSVNLNLNEAKLESTKYGGILFLILSNSYK